MRLRHRDRLGIDSCRRLNDRNGVLLSLRNPTLKRQCNFEVSCGLIAVAVCKQLPTQRHLGEREFFILRDGLC